MADSEDTILLGKRKSRDKSYQTIFVNDIEECDEEQDTEDKKENSKQDFCEPANDQNNATASTSHVTECLYHPPPTTTTIKDDPDFNRLPNENELIFRLKFSHLAPGTSWFDEVQAVSRATSDVGVYLRVLGTLKEYPLTIEEKILLSEKIRTKLDVSSVASSSSKLAARKSNSEPNQKKKKTSLSHRWISGLSVPFGLWNKRIGQIAAYFGSHVASYFQFLRFLTVMNAGITIIMFLFVSLPQIISLEVWSSDVKTGFFGELSHTIFFYGAYHNTSVIINFGSLSYNRPLAYLMTWSVGNVLAILAIVFSMFVSYRRIKKSDDNGDEPFTSHTFLGWDHSVTSHEGGKMMSLAFTTHIREMVREEKVKRRHTQKET